MSDAHVAPRLGSLDRGAVSVWFQAFRVKSLFISSIAVFAGAAVAVHDGYFDLWRLFLAWFGSIAIQAGTNLINVYHNYKAGSGAPGFRPDPKGSSAVIQQGLLTPAQVRRGGLTAFSLGIACGLILAWLCGWQILWLGLPSVAAGYFYAGPPVRLGYLALGVVTVFMFMGPVMVGGTYFVLAKHFSVDAFVASIPVGLFAAGIMHVNDLRDYDSDLAHRKRTLSTLFGRQRAIRLLALMDAVAYGVTITGVSAHLLPWPVLLTLITIPHALGQVRMVQRESDPAKLNIAWFKGIQVHMEFGVLFILGLLIAAALKI